MRKSHETEPPWINQINSFSVSWALVIIKLYLFYPELTSMEIINATARHFFISGAGPLTLLFAKFTEDRMIHKASCLWNFSWVVFSNFFSLISCITVIFCQLFSIRNFNPLFTFVFNLYEYFRQFSFSSVSGQVAVAVGFFTRDPSLIWNTVVQWPAIILSPVTCFYLYQFKG